MIHVLIADHQELFRIGMAEVLAVAGDVRIVGRPKSPEQLLNTLKEVNPQKLTWKTVIAEIPEVVITHLSLSISRGAISARLDSSCYSLPKVVFLRLVLVDGAPSIGESSNTTSRKVANAVDSARRRSGVLLCVSRKDWGLQQRYRR